MRHLTRLNALPLFMGIVLLAASYTRAQTPDVPLPFVVRRGDKLFARDQEFRFVSMNIPNLHIVEDNFEDGGHGPWRWPNRFEITDALESVRQMGGTVIRTYVLSVARDDSDMGQHVHVREPGRFNEEAFRTLDLVLQIAREKGIRVIIPFVDQWRWWGGIEQYAAHRDLPPESFWTDPQLISDFQKTVRFTVTRVNTLTRVPYAEDPAILGWETGNELDAPPAWTSQIAKYIRSLDAKHLIIDGRSLHGISDEALANEHTDVLTTHHYPSPHGDMVEEIRTAIARTRGRKPYFVGEFGFVRRDVVERILDEVVASDCSGALLWSLRFHSRDGGFYWHSEPAAEGRYKAYHWPGFASGHSYEGRDVLLQLMRPAALRIQDLSLPLPPLPCPTAPSRLCVSTGRALRWRGAAGADRYHVLRSPHPQGAWTRVAVNLSDADHAYRPIWHDAEAAVGRDWYYRVVAANDSGESPPSHVFGPVRFSTWHLVDEFRDTSMFRDASRPLQIVSANARRTREDFHRLELHPGDHVTYAVEGMIRRVVLRYFRPDEEGTIVASVAGHDRTFLPLLVDSRTLNEASGDYGYAQFVELASTAVPDEACLLRVEARGSRDSKATVELSWLDLEYGK